MATARDIVVGGFSPGQAKAIGGQVNSSVSAAGTTQTDATALVSSVNVITTAAAGSGVRLPSVEIGDEFDILNLGANGVVIYPATGERINALATNIGFTLGTNTSCKIKKFTSTRNTAILSA
jgi:hypothetical protein